MTAPPTDLARTFDARWQQLALGETLAVPPDSTITPRTLSAATFVEAATQVAPAPGGEEPILEPLPRISLGFRSDGAPGDGPRTSNADLELSTVLGEGGMGRVHLARQRSLRRDVAVKTLKAEADAATQRALFNEAVIAGSLEHPSIIPVHALGADDDGRPVLVMKRVEGVEWRELLRDAGHPAWKSRAASGDHLEANLEILIQICNALELAHSRGIVHRDVKPENVMIGRFGEVYLLDFGIAVHASAPGPGAGQLFGTPGYMAPEMVLGAAVDARTDVYLLGATLHEVLTGELRHAGDRLHDVLFNAFASPPIDYGPDVPEELARLCNRATHRDPAERPQSAREMRQALSDHLRHRGSIALSDAARERLDRLEAMLAADDRRAEPDWLTAVQELMAEARFGFTQALDAWPDNEGAKAGRQACLEAMIRFEVSRENLSAAAGFLDQLSEPRPALVAAVDALRSKLAADRKKQSALEKLAHDVDITVGAGSRLKVVVIVGAVVLSVSGYVFSRSGGTQDLTAGSALAFGVYVLVAAIGVIIAFRKALFANAFNARLVGLLLVTGSAVVLHRLAAFLTGEPVPRIFAMDGLLMATCVAIAAATLHRLLILPAVVLAGGAVVEYAWPTVAVEAFAVSTTVALVVMLLGLEGSGDAPG
jgi:serine/threonine-protein kinase